MAAARPDTSSEQQIVLPLVPVHEVYEGRGLVGVSVPVFLFLLFGSAVIQTAPSWPTCSTATPRSSQHCGKTALEEEICVAANQL